jgi:4-amino-4-deoxy-L-arabinose transferase-like glycosyltransferase
MAGDLKQKLILLLILLLGAFFRFYGLDWDQGQHLHPDERFLTMVGNAMQMPTSIQQYLDPKASLMNPTNINFTFFVYGTFPIVLNKVLAVSVHTDNYSAFTLQGRLLSGFADLFIILFIYKLAHLLEEKYRWDAKIKIYAAFFYAIAVLPIQLAHFFAVDTFLSLFILATLYFSLRFYYKKSWLSFICCAVAMGLGLGTKITSIFVLPLILLFLTGGILSKKHKNSNLRSLIYKPSFIITFILASVSFAVIVYTITRIADPYLFQDGNFFNIHPNIAFIENLQTLKGWENASFPPSVQWVHKTPVIFSLINLAVFGVGIPYFIFILIGVFVVLFKQRKVPVLIIFLWVLGIFLYQSTQFVKAMRYFIFLYPLLALLAAIGCNFLLDKKHMLLKAIIVFIIMIWPISYMSIYSKPHSRVTASQWIYNNISNGSMIVSEYWDDPLPLLLPNQTKQFPGEQVSVFEFDTQEKWQKMNDILQRGDYYILSSNRGWGSIPTVPEHFPQTSRFYNDLLKGKTKYKLIAEFTSYPTFPPFFFEELFSVSFPDQWADESFTVYDHPKVMVFKNTKQ